MVVTTITTLIWIKLITKVKFSTIKEIYLWGMEIVLLELLDKLLRVEYLVIKLLKLIILKLETLKITTNNKIDKVLETK